EVRAGKDAPATPGRVPLGDHAGAAAPLVVHDLDGVQPQTQGDGAGGGLHAVEAAVVHDLRAVHLEHAAVVAGGPELVAARGPDQEAARPAGGDVVDADVDADAGEGVAVGRGEVERDRQRADHGRALVAQVGRVGRVEELVAD